MHLVDEEIQRILHGELKDEPRRASLRHLGECAGCRARVEEAARAEQDIFALLEQVDHPIPPVSIKNLMRTTRQGRGMGWTRRAAVIALVVGGAGVAYAAPGSPLPRWINSIATALAGEHPSQPPGHTAPRREAVTPESGIAVAPGRRFTIAFTSDQPSGAATVRLTDGSNIVVRAVNGGAVFRTDTGRLTISNNRSVADYEIDLPRTAPWVEILVARRRLFLKNGARVVGEMSTVDDDRYSMPLRPAKP
jgi:anti-sigma factor RsiW